MTGEIKRSSYSHDCMFVRERRKRENMLDKKRKLNYRRALGKLRNQAMRNITKRKPGTAERAYGDGYIAGIDDAMREFDFYGKAEDQW